MNYEALRLRHYPVRSMLGIEVCRACNDFWPCDVKQLIEENKALIEAQTIRATAIRKLEQERRTLRGIVVQHEFCQWDFIIGQHCMFCKAREDEQEEHQPQCPWRIVNERS